MNYLAFGIQFETGVTNSMKVRMKDKETVHDLMKNKFDTNFDAIFLIANSTITKEDCPEVVEHYAYTY